MVDINEDMILNISNIMNDKNQDIYKSDLTKDSKNNNKFKRKAKFLDGNKKYKLINSYSTDENELFRNTYNFRFNNNTYSNETIFPVKIKKMAKSDIIIKDESTKDKNVIKKNKNKIHKKNLIKKQEQVPIIYKCDKCNKEYNIKNSYQKHLLTHNKKIYICSKCDAKFAIKSKYNRHLLIHNDLKEFKCPLCDSAFHLKYNLKVHLRVHNNEKPYICGFPGCFAKFAQKNNLNTHTKIHSHKLNKENDEIKMLLNYHNNIIKFNNKCKNFLSKLEELNKIALNE